LRFIKRRILVVVDCITVKHFDLHIIIIINDTLLYLLPSSFSLLLLLEIKKWYFINFFMCFPSDICYQKNIKILCTFYRKFNVNLILFKERQKKWKLQKYNQNITWKHISNQLDNSASKKLLREFTSYESTSTIGISKNFFEWFESRRKRNQSLDGNDKA
jgi:hypothetical protein